MNTKKFTGYIVEFEGQFWIDKKNFTTGKDLVQPHQNVSFLHKKRLRHATVTSHTVGPRNDMYLLENVT